MDMMEKRKSLKRKPVNQDLESPRPIQEKRPSRRPSRRPAKWKIKEQQPFSKKQIDPKDWPKRPAITYPRKPQIITDPEKKKRYQNLMDQSRRMTGSEKRNIKRPPKLKRRNTRRMNRLEELGKRLAERRKEPQFLPRKPRKKYNIGGRANLLEEVGRLDAEKMNPNRRAEKKRVIGELNKGYKGGGMAQRGLGRAFMKGGKV